MPRKHNHTAWLLLVCAHCQSAPGPAVSFAQPMGGVILSQRPFHATATFTPPIRAVLLALDLDPAGTRPPSICPGTEFILRTDDGRLLSVVEAPDLVLPTGHRVTILPGQQTHLLPAPGGW